MLRLGHLKDWAYVEEGSSLNFENDRPRRVIVEVRSEFPVRLFVDYGEGMTFLAKVDGYEQIEWHVPGAFHLVADEGAFSARSQDSSFTHIPNDDEEIFTKFWEKRTVSPEQRRVLEVMEMNKQFYLAQAALDKDIMQRTLDNAIRKLEEKAAEAAAAAVPAPAGEAAVAPEPPKGDAGKGGANTKKDKNAE